MTERTCSICGKAPAWAYRMSRGYRRPDSKAVWQRAYGSMDLCDDCLATRVRPIKRRKP